MKSRKSKGGSLFSSPLGAFFTCTLSLLGCALVAAAVLAFFERPMAAIPAAALLVSLLSGGISGLLCRGKSNGWIGTVTLVGLWLIFGTVFTKGHFPLVSFVYSASFLVCHFACRLVAKRKRKRKTHR